MKILIPLLLSSFALAAPAPQHQEPDSFGHSRHGEAFNEGPRQAAYRMEGMSDQVHMPVAGISDEAQAFFDQGLTQLHGFWHFESERSFRQVAKLHPECAMAYWGLALANLENVERAVGFIAKAVTHAEELPRYEELWVDAWAAYYLVDDDLRAELRSDDEERMAAAVEALQKKNDELSEEEREDLDRQLLKDIGTVLYEFPDDIEAKALLAVQIWLASGWGDGIEIVSHTAVDALLDAVFAQAPRHPAHHYRVHLWDREEAERALRSAAALGDSAPGVAHQWHMAGHIYAKLDRHDEAAWQQEASSRVDHAHMRRDRVMPFEIHNYGHNQEWLSRSLSYQGRIGEALAVAKNLAELPRHPTKNDLAERSIARLARLRMASLCEEQGLWETALELRNQGYLEPSSAVRGEVLRIGLLGRALFRLGRVDEAEALAAEVAGLLPRARAERARIIDEAEEEALADKRERTQIDELLEEAQEEGTDVVRAVLDLELELDAERLLAEGDAAGAVAIFEELDGFPKTLLADAHVAAGDLAAAIELLEEEVTERPNRLPSLGRLVLAYRAANDPEQLEKLAEREAELAAMVAADGPLAARLGLPTPRPMTTADFSDEFGARPQLASLGPQNWTPVEAPGFDLPVAGGGRRVLGAPFGKPTLVVFYLGFGCLHCVEQLTALTPHTTAFADAGIDIVAIGSDTVEQATLSIESWAPDDRFPFPLLADPELAAFKRWRCYDDFEEMPLHGTFLVDADGKVRWQDISYEPFTELEWLLDESRRLLALPAPRSIVSK